MSLRKPSGRFGPQLVSLTPWIGLGAGILLVLLGVGIIAWFNRPSGKGSSRVPSSGSGTTPEISQPRTTPKISKPSTEFDNLIKIIEDYVEEIQKANDPQKTEIQCREAISAAKKKFETRIEDLKERTFTFQGQIMDITPEGPVLGPGFTETT
jgi:flagellar motility protein MotE (MotC chaperone)